MSFDVTQFGARGDRADVQTAEFQKAIDTCAAKGGGTIVVPAGTYVVGAIWLRSNITLHLEAGALLKGSEREEDFPLWRSAWEGPGERSARVPLIAGEGLENVAITGRGTIDGNGPVWWERHHRVRDCPRPWLIRLVDSRNVLVEGVTLRNSPFWTLSPLACENVTINGITIINPADSPNTDGVNPDSCRNVRILNCHIDVGDDCITLKSGKEDDGRQHLKACENITISNCTLVHGHGGVVIGSEVSGSIRNVTISNCVFVGTDRGIRLKARRGRGGIVEDIRVSNLVMDGVLCPIVINLFYGCGNPSPESVDDRIVRPVDSTTPQFRRLRFSNITAVGAKYAAMYVLGLPEMYVEDVALSDVMIQLDRENRESGKPAMSPVVEPHCRSGCIVRNTRGLVLRNVEIAHQVGEALLVTDSEGVTVGGLIATSAAAGPAVRLRGVREADVRGLRVAEGFDCAVSVSGPRTRNVRVEDDVRSVSTHVQVSSEVEPGEVVAISGR
jgi:polygalacturonase